MAKQDTTRVLWKVQVRISRAHKWKNKGAFETRKSARHEAYLLREGMGSRAYYGFGNTRVIRHVRGQR